MKKNFPKKDSHSKTNILWGKFNNDYEPSKDIIVILRNRIIDLMFNLNKYKFLPEEDWESKVGYFLNKTIEGYKHSLFLEIEKSSEAEIGLSENDMKEIYSELSSANWEEMIATFDEILCQLEPEFMKVVDKIIENDLELIPPKQLMNIVKTTCERLISIGVINSPLTETKKQKAISSILIPEIEKKYILTSANKRSISEYFRKFKLLITTDNEKRLVVKKI